MDRFAGAQFSERGGCAAVHARLEQTTPKSAGRENDFVVESPESTAQTCSVAERLGRTAIGRDLLELALRVKHNEAAIR